jgi:hypothetical protein
MPAGSCEMINTNTKAPQNQLRDWHQPKGHLMPESELTEEELDRVHEYLEKNEAGVNTSPVMIFRAFIQPSDRDANSSELKKAA